MRKIGLQRFCGEEDQRRVAYGVIQSGFNICLQVVLLAKPFAKVFRLPAIHIVQTDLAELPVSKQKPLDCCTGDYPSSDYAKGSCKGIGGKMFSRQRRRSGSVRSADDRC